jgi:hypothetical protein
MPETTFLSTGLNGRREQLAGKADFGEEPRVHYTSPPAEAVGLSERHERLPGKADFDEWP